MHFSQSSSLQLNSYNPAESRQDDQKMLQSVSKPISTLLSLQTNPISLLGQKVQDLYSKIARGQQRDHLVNHPFSSLQQKIKTNEVILIDGRGKKYNFGAHLHGVGGPFVKGNNIVFRIQEMDGKEAIEVDFKINHAFREKLNQSIKMLQQEETKQILQYAGSRATDISISQDVFFPDYSEDAVCVFENGSVRYESRIFSKAHKVVFEGLGAILIGSCPYEPTLYDRVVVRLDSDKTLSDLHELLALVDLDPSICLSTYNDLERLKMGHLFRAFFPREATPFERTEEFFFLSLDQLKAKMIELAPDMEEILSSYLHRMTAEHLFDGRIRYQIVGLAKEAYHGGARVLAAGICSWDTLFGSAWENEEDLLYRVASILKMGLLSAETRQINKFSCSGLGSHSEFYKGGSDSVFTQLFTEKNFHDRLNLKDNTYHAPVRFLISLKALELGTYQYHTGLDGTRIYERPSVAGERDPIENSEMIIVMTDDERKAYYARESILEFIRKEHLSNSGHEVLFKERIPPSYIIGVIVGSEELKSAIFNHLQECGLVVNGLISDIPVDKFIHVATHLTEDLIDTTPFL